ncbi:MAG: M23 family metallopeptidase [Desulfarculus sp.]|nr:M23 family metallopeptidase [Desulfarculus sp.]
MSLARKIPLILLLVLVVAAGLGLVVVWPHLEGQDPQLIIKSEPTHLGRLSILELSLGDEGTGLASLRVTAIQNGKEYKLLEKNYATGSTWERHGLGQASEKLEIKALEQGMVQGPATLIIKVRDRSLRNWFHGNLAERQFQVLVDTIPPKVTVLSRTIHLNRGGVGLAVYKANKPLAVHGVQVGKRFFPGVSPWPQDPLAGMAYFAYGDDEDKNASLKVMVQDQAGNQAGSGLTVRLKWKEFKSDTLNISDNFLDALAPRFMAEAPPAKQQPLEVFLWVNEELRRQNHQQILQVCSTTSPQQLWRGTFIRPLGKPMAGFADRRSYVYKGREVSQSTHLGVDLADLAMSPIKSTAAGKVVFAGPLGIYGNCVILDHGQGIFSLYGHMSEASVRPGEMVPLEGVLGRSGATGLALGDHLHFSILVGGVFVTPTEWWDPHWIKDNVELRFQEASLPWPLAAR